MPINSKNNASPFFAPTTPRAIAQTPGGTRRSVKKEVEETKSTVSGATSNLINAIVGSGIVGIPFAIRQAGLVAGFFLVCLCAFLTEKSLRILVETAKHAGTSTYETAMEAAFGRFGFLFVTINMFIMSYGALVSYLMIIKDTLPYVFGISDLASRRAFLFLVSFFVIVPLSSQRDMANLAKTSRLSVMMDIVMVCLVAYLAPIGDSLEQVGGFFTLVKSSIIHGDTVFIGLGVLSFAFVCQHSAFIIAGSLENPTNARWSSVTMRALWVCAGLANLCGLSGYLGYQDETQGNILNNLNEDETLANVARGMLGMTMLFVYPMESFVARHVCVVALFSGRRAHEGEDAAILNRRDRRIGLTVALYILALVPALFFENVGNVLSVTGAISGSCLSYIGPGFVYLGIHGGEFLEIVDNIWNTHSNATNRETPEMKALNAVNVEDLSQAPSEKCSLTRRFLKGVIWYLIGMPIWHYIARVGASGYKSYQREKATKSPYISKLGNAKANNPPRRQLGSFGSLYPSDSNLSSYQQGNGPHITLIPPNSNRHPPQNISLVQSPMVEADLNATTEVFDYVVAIGFILFGIVALVAGIVSIFYESTH
mmetsp:Transcript_24078/g.35645  ORF Transcript_24078/g.35645 Transcript_24078/m.35645 type:complete len:598 (-) Transcript_24078:655-2448(-)|eukprot:CAMPEP_0194225892 /NCGR_PEP_ID=MMETSP0156-20130528/40613_1 /TAXON_ID=33649 /ORGANISM="Thalassionema nitzschioides, Strain L26-B" /LENGTH=597 /DNA_ID=CAMNT_0038958027 /DNA_START=127 /DNA_END=1920 /DNA_ORIENTATION=-